MAGDLGELLADLQAESDELHAIVGPLSPEALATATPAEGWSIADSIGHLWFFDREGRRALDEPDEFRASLDDLMSDPEAFLADHLTEIRRLGGSASSAWQEERRLLVAAMQTVDPATRVPWYGPAMSVMSFATARLMETWAHGQDIVDALGATRTPTERLRHIADLGVRTRAFSYAIKGREAPDVPVLVSLTSPGGNEWSWGDPGCDERVSGSAVDFCLLVTQRRMLVDLALTISGPAAEEWMSLAQAFAGGPSLTDEHRRGMSPTY